MDEQSTDIDRERLTASAEHARLYSVLDQDAARAVAEARELAPGPDLRDVNVRAIRAAIFIDAGCQLSDASLVAEAVQLLREMDLASSPQFAYNLANGLAALAKLTGKVELGQLDTASPRQEARALFHYAAENSSEPSIKSSSLTNQANLLKDSYRWVEAYDGYVSALQQDPANAIALSGISSLLRWRMKGLVDEEGPLRRVAVRYLLRAHAHLDGAHRYAGPKGVARVEELMREFDVSSDTPQPDAEAPPASPYADFVRRHRLALCLEPETIGATLGRWDHLAIRSVSEPIDADSRIPTVFTSWNVLKSDFLAARWLAHASMNGYPPETGFYSDTLDYANYGTRYSGLVLAQKAAFDVLDKIAVATTDYLKLPGNPKPVYFGTRWHLPHPKQRGRLLMPLQWQAEIAAEIAEGNSSLIALAELAYDYATGYLRAKKNIRNSGTHGLIVLHDMMIDGHSRPSAIIERYSQDEFERLLVESLQIARAGLMYFREVVSFRESRHRLNRSRPALPLVVPSHHWIRGEDPGA